jgi:Mn2+/Fe2+ NRAMP family transporter
MKKFELDKIWLGCIAGIIFPLIAYLIYFAVVHYLNLRRINISICMVSNLIPFYLSMNREKYNFTKGVILITIIMAVVITALSYFTNAFKILQ